MKQAIICVDDEAIILLSLKRELSMHFGSRFIYETALNAIDALELVEEMAAEGIPIVFIISDWLMPVMKGDEFLIKVHEKHPEILSIIISGQANDESIELARCRCNLISYIKKPYRPEILFQAIEKGMSRIETEGYSPSPHP